MKKSVIAPLIMALLVVSALIGLRYFSVNPNNRKINKVYAWNDPQLYNGSLYGKVITVEFTVVDIYLPPARCYLKAHPDWKKYFGAVIKSSDYEKFPTDLKKHFYMKKIRVTGELTEVKKMEIEKPGITIIAPSQVKIVE